MRLRKTQNGITLNIVAGTSAVLFSIDMEEAAISDLLGFYIHKTNLETGVGYDVNSIRHFPNYPKSADGQYSTKENPWQSFLWEDFYVSNGARYEYQFTPVRGTSTALQYAPSISVVVNIPAARDGKHEVHFNRGVAGSQAYARKFHNLRPDEMDEPARSLALTWLSKGLKEALIGFVGKAENSEWKLRCCFYEFIFPELHDALKTAITRGADVKVIYDSRHEALKNDTAISLSGIDRSILIRRAADPAFLQHNKYMVLLHGDDPVAVWTGSTNITEKAIYGHCNVGHIIRDSDVARKYLQHWEGLSTDPLNQEARSNSVAIQNDISEIPKGITTFFSPRPKGNVLKVYADLVANSQQLVCGMFPFSFSKLIKAAISADTEQLKYVIIDKKDANTTLASNDVDNVIIYGGVYDNPLYEWAAEKSSGSLFKPGVNYIHNKVILIDPLSTDPVVITGSANFSDNSVLRNDENTLVVRGNTELADLYFTEFSRIFNHYASRHGVKKMTAANQASGYNPSHLQVDPKKWTASFFSPNALKAKRRAIFTQMIAVSVT